MINDEENFKDSIISTSMKENTDQRLINEMKKQIGIPSLFSLVNSKNKRHI